MLINQKLISKADGIEYLIVDLCDGRELIAATQINDKQPLRPTLLKMQEVLKNIQNNLWELTDSKFTSTLFMSDEEILKKDSSRQKWLDRRDEAYKVIAPLVEDDEKRYDYLFGDASGVLRELIEKSGRSRKYVSQTLNRYWYFGSHKNALLPLWRNCGSNSTLPEKPVFDDEGQCSVNKSGPKTRYGSEYRGATQEDIKNINKFAKKIPKGGKVRLSYLYEEFCREYLYPTVKPTIDDAEALVIRLPKKYLISPESFKYHLKKAVGPLEFIRRAVGDISYQKDKKGKPGLARQGLRGPTSRYEIDATIVDQYIRYPFDNTEQLATGRPVIYLVVDTWSGMIVGTHACFHGPDWTGASQALFNAFTNKVEFCQRYGIDIKEEDWPCNHVCSQLTMDRGSEYTDKHIEGMIKGMIGVTIGSFTAYHRGDCKGTVEHAFKIIQDAMVNFVPGQVIKIPQKEAQHASREASMSFELFMQKLIKSILFTNNNRLRSENHTFEMSRDGVGFSPRDLYVYGLEEMMIPPAKVSEDKLRFALLPSGKATVHAQGIYFGGLYYNSNAVTERQWLDIAKNVGRFKLDIRYDSNSTNFIWCKDTETDEILTLELTERSELYRNQLWADALHNIELTKHKQSIHKEAAFSNKIDLLNDLKDIDEMSLAQIRHLKKSPAKSIQKGMKERAKLVSDIEKKNQSDAVAQTLNTEKPEVTQPGKQQDLTTPDFFNENDN
ncbi:integrase [Vibrio vulnificus]|uniref:integrase n=1 Tax=Vibrio vulnificus TaxID=672 RepID=UPI00102B0BCA|nr:integrase [Vibrio vulnificus]RZR09485.1 integrase [Vibrio vulnificus]